VLAGLRDAVRNVLAVAIGIALGAAAILAALMFVEPRAAPQPFNAAGQAAWTEIEWPLPADVWSAGKAFRCSAAACGGEVTLYVRAKIGFCNCTTGVADDDELERLADLYLFAGRHSPDGPGHLIGVAWMKGRSRSYSIAGGQQHGKSALTIAFNDRCDAIVATAIVAHDQTEVVENAVLAFVNGAIILKWAQLTLGL
jgi:hypothetical protein